DLVKIEAKMSKSKPETCVFIHDTEEDLLRKFKKAYCPAKVVDGNLIIEIAKYVIFARDKVTLNISRPEKFGGDLEYIKYGDLEKDYVAGKLHPLDLKNAVAQGLGKILEPVHKYFEKKPETLEAVERMLAETKMKR
ncbi:MAG: tyrosine--tRNA ligase, partial [Candidatus Heimdallarchaeota archaeon]